MKNIGEILQNLGDTSPSEYVCPICKKPKPPTPYEILGKVRYIQIKCKCEIDKFNQEMERMQEAERKRRVEQKFSICHLGQRFMECKLDSFTPRPGTEPVINIAKKYIHQFDRWGEKSLLLWGNPGNGKSHLAAAIAHELKREKIVVFQTVTELLERIRSTFRKDNKESEHEVMAALLDCDLLILDDIGAEKVTDWVLDILFRIVDGRYRAKKPILYTTNYHPDELRERFTPREGGPQGARILDRIVECAVIVENKGSSYREEQAKERMKKMMGG